LSRDPYDCIAEGVKSSADFDTVFHAVGLCGVRIVARVVYSAVVHEGLGVARCILGIFAI
jgi:hypothetical protein